MFVLYILMYIYQLLQDSVIGLQIGVHIIACCSFNSCVAGNSNDWGILLRYMHRTPDNSVPLVNLPDNKGWTPLHYACYDNNTKLVQQLIKAGTNANAKYVYNTD